MRDIINLVEGTVIPFPGMRKWRVGQRVLIRFKSGHEGTGTVAKETVPPEGVKREVSIYMVTFDPDSAVYPGRTLPVFATRLYPDEAPRP